MTWKPVCIRAEPGLSLTRDAGRAAGCDIVGLPLFTIVPRAWTLPDPIGLDGLLIGSANALRHGGVPLETLTHLPVHAVGEATAALARGLGFTVATVGSGGLQRVVDSLAGQNIRLLRIAGESHVPLTPPKGITVIARIAYRAVPLTLDPASLPEHPLVLLHSAEAARHWAAECDRIGIARGSIALAALGPRIAAAARDGWAEVRSAPEPSDAALLALVAQMCQTCDQGIASGPKGPDRTRVIRADSL